MSQNIIVSSNDDKNPNEHFFDKKIILLIVGTVIFIISFLYLCTRHALWDCFNFSSTGQIGDTIGGITAPIINFVGAILVYISFKSQISANEQQFNRWNKESQNQIYDRNFQIALNLFTEVKNDFSKTSYDNSYGAQATAIFANTVLQMKSVDFILERPYYHEILFVVSEFEVLVFFLDSKEFRDEEKKYLSLLFIPFYNAQFKYILNSFEAKDKNTFSDIIKKRDSIVSIMSQFQ